MMLLDVLREDGGAAVELATALYTAVLQRAPGVWRFLYSSWNRLPGLNALRTSWMTRRFRETENAVRRFNPETILTTHPLASAIAARMKRRDGLWARLVTAYWDWHFQPFCCFPEVDHYLVPLPRQREAFIAAGTPPSRVTVSGILVAPEFRVSVPRMEARAQLRLPEDRPVVLVLGGGRGWGLEPLARSIVRLRTPISAVFLCGSRERRIRLERLVAGLAKGAVEIRLLGFEANPAPYYHAADLIVSKPSGLSPAQAFACGTPMLAVSPEPGHEEANLVEFTGCGAVLVPRPSEDPAAAISRLLANPAALAAASASARKLVAIDTEAVALAVLAPVMAVETAVK
ncbi:MAG TPA: glycosyltransferase [Bryobacteraceae bacterium]